MNYLNDIATKIKAGVPANDLPHEETEGLFRIYAVLLLAKGEYVTREDVHNAWVAWMTPRDPRHPSLVPSDQLKTDIAADDEPYVRAIHAAARSLTIAKAPLTDLDRDLFPKGMPTGSKDLDTLFDLYKLIVASSESLVARRQGVNTFFLTINGALLTAAGLILSNGRNQAWNLAGIVILALTGFVLSLAWNSLIRSFGQLNSGKFKVINRIEQLLPAAIFIAEWKALGEGKKPGIYRTFTSRETWVPRVLCAVYLIGALVGLALLLPLKSWLSRITVLS